MRLTQDTYTVKDLCRVLYRSKTAVYRWIARGMLKAYRDSCGRYIIYKDDLERFVEKYPKLI